MVKNWMMFACATLMLGAAAEQFFKGGPKMALFYALLSAANYVLSTCK